MNIRVDAAERRDRLLAAAHERFGRAVEVLYGGTIEQWIEIATRDGACGATLETLEECLLDERGRANTGLDFIAEKLDKRVQELEEQR